MKVVNFDDFCSLPAPVLFQELPCIDSESTDVGALSVRGGVTHFNGRASSFVCVRTVPDSLVDVVDGCAVEWPESSYRDGPFEYVANARRRFLVWDRESVELLRTMLGSASDFFGEHTPKQVVVE
ncbi:hypothetical protein [Burkholderia sp. Tr-20390]|uniref:hypothetical protein n=1 Tax=Burkholderia sp. Tr-20390 TaxID=2703904 RepID=UPI00197F33F1|nr:hypothetical protein [Burkholderia sp. Tr-20390]MBN3729391.1 hypothetical protein [Burkholderia sp. Tr-20390]